MNARQAKKMTRNYEEFGIYEATGYHDCKVLSREYWEENVAMHRTEDRWLSLEVIGNHRPRQVRKAVMYRVHRSDLGCWESPENNYYVAVYMDEGRKLMEYQWAGGSGRQQYNSELFDEIVFQYGLKKVR